MGQHPSFRDVMLKAILEVLGMLILVMPMAYIYVISSHFPPYQRGFFCDDQNLKHPYVGQTVPIIVAFVIWAVMSIMTIVGVETLRSNAAARAKIRKAKPVHDAPRLSWTSVELYRHLGYFTLGALTCLLFTEMAKYTVGRLRPHYLTICNPDLSPANCKDDNGYNKYWVIDEDKDCRPVTDEDGNELYSTKQLHEARLSFLSGHSSFSFYCATFLIVYLQARLSNFPQQHPAGEKFPRWLKFIYRLMKAFRPFIQFAMLILAFWISLTRISDYFHHPMDVVTGALVGVLFACITLIIIADIFKKDSSFFRSISLEQHDSNLEIQNNSSNRTVTQSPGPAALAPLDDIEYIDNERIVPGHATSIPLHGKDNGNTRYNSGGGRNHFDTATRYHSGTVLGQYQSDGEHKEHSHREHPRGEHREHYQTDSPARHQVRE